MKTPKPQSKPIHGAPVPFHIRHGLASTPSIPCGFNLGDKVTFTNDAGLKFPVEVRGFATNPHEFGRTVYVFPDNDAWWCPVKPESLKLVSMESKGLT